MGFDIKHLELILSERANNIISPYAYYVFITDEEYNNLFFNREIFFNERVSVSDYPWCHIKLLTETYVRESKQEDDWKKAKTITLEKLGKLSNKFLWNDSFINALDKTNLKIIRENNGVKEKIYYKNLISHSGVPGSYFERLFENIKNLYKKKGSKEDITIDALTDNLLEDSNIFTFKTSKFFKEAFNEKDDKKSLFSWFLNLVGIEEEITNHNFDINLLNLESKEIPSSFFIHLKNISKLKKIIKEDQRNKNILNKIIFDDGDVKYLVQFPKIIDDISRFEITINGERDDKWQKVLYNSSKEVDITFKILPKHLDKKILHNFNNKFFINQISLPLNILIFDEQFNFINPRGSYKINTNLTILSRKELNLKKAKEIYDLSDAWYKWKHYEISGDSVKINIGELPAPYHNTSFEFTNEITGEWKLEKGFICKRNGIVIFGGNEPPIFKFFSDQDIKKYNVIASFESNEIIKNYGSIKNLNGEYLWKCTDQNFTASKYNINIQLIDSKLNVIKGFSECIWYPSLQLKVHPENLLLDNEPCNIQLYFQGNLNLIKSIPDLEFKPDLIENHLLWNICKKPAFVTPHMIFKYNNDIIDINLRLPYISVWVYSEKQKNNLYWDTNNPFEKDTLEVLYDKDIKVRVWFYYHGNIKEKFSVIGIRDEKKEIIKSEEYFDFTRESPHYSIAYGDLRSYNDIYIIYNNKRVSLFKEKVINTKIVDSDNNFWNFELINNYLKEKILYKNIWQYWKK